MHAHAIGRRGRVLRRANERAQRRFHAMFDAHVWSDPDAAATRLYVEAERLVDAVMEPEEHRLPVVQFEDILAALSGETAGQALRRRAVAGYADRADEYRTRGA